MSVKSALSIFFFLAGLAIPLSLGVWQIYRAEWKADILERLDKEYAKDATQYMLSAEDILGHAEGFKIVSGSLRGQFISDKTLYWPSPKEGNFALNMMSPFQTEAGDVVMVMRGFVFQDLKTRQPVEKIDVPVSVPLKISGILRAKEHNYFTPQNNQQTNNWYRFDAQEIGEYFQINEPISPYVLFSETASGTDRKILGEVDQVRIYPNNRHLQYAAFWLTLAGLWAVIIGWKLIKKL